MKLSENWTFRWVINHHLHSILRRIEASKTFCYQVTRYLQHIIRNSQHRRAHGFRDIIRIILSSNQQAINLWKILDKKYCYQGFACVRIAVDTRNVRGIIIKFIDGLTVLEAHNWLSGQAPAQKNDQNKWQEVRTQLDNLILCHWSVRRRATMHKIDDQDADQSFRDVSRHVDKRNPKLRAKWKKRAEVHVRVMTS